MKVSWLVLFSAVSILIIGFLLSEPTSLGFWHPLLGDSMIMVTLWWVIRKEELRNL